MVAASLGISNAAGPPGAIDPAELDADLARGAADELARVLSIEKAREAPLGDSRIAAWVAAWEIAGDEAARGLARYRELARSPGDPKHRELATLCDRSMRLVLLDADPDKRAAAVEEMEATGLERFAEPLDLAIERDPAAGLRGNAAHALRRIGGRRARALLRADLAHSDPQVRRLAADELARMNDNSALRYLRKEARTGTRDDKLWASEMLSRLGDPSAISVLSDLIQDPEAWYRAEVVRILDRYDDPRTAPLLERGLTDSSDEIRLASAAALADLGDSSGLAVLREFAKGPIPTQRVRALEQLGKLDDRDSIPLIREGLHAESELVRDQAALTLQAMGDPEGQAYAAKKEGAFGSLGALAGALLAGRRAAPDQPPPPPPEVTASNQAVDKYKRAQSIRELSAMGPAGLPGLRAGLVDPDALVRNAAARALGKAGGPNDLDLLVALLADPDVRVRLAAAGAILVVLDS